MVDIDSRSVSFITLEITATMGHTHNEILVVDRPKYAKFL